MKDCNEMMFLFRLGGGVVRRWQRIDPDVHKEIRLKMSRMVYDGDHAAQNDYTMRKNYTIQEMINIHNEYEHFIKEREQYQKELNDFITKALNGEIEISLAHATEDIFMSSNQQEEFWKVCFKLYKLQNK
jgi:hypothetical protein